MDDETTDVGNTQPQDNGVNGNGGFEFAPEYRDNPSITKFGGDVNKLAGSYLALQSLMGQGRVVIPKDANDITAWQAYDKALGIPEEADGYNLEAPEGVDMTGFNELMKVNHIPPAAAKNIFDALVNDFTVMQESEEKEAETKMQQAEASLRKEWGLKYKENIDNAANCLRKMCDSEDEYNYYNQKIGNDAKMLKLLAKMGEMTAEGNLGGFDGGARKSFTLTPAEAQAELNAILANPDDAYFAGVGSNRRTDVRWCRENNKSWVSEAERKARVDYVNSLLLMTGQSE